MNLPPDSFYYVLSVLFGGGMLWLIRSYIVRTDKMLNQLTEAVGELKTIVAVHEEKHAGHDEKHIHIHNRLEEKVNPVIAQMDATLNRLNQTLVLLTAEERPRRRATQ